MRTIITMFALALAMAGSVNAQEPPETLWDKTFGGAYGDRGYSLQQTSDDGFILWGQTSPSFFQFGGWLIRTDGDGNELWNRTYGGDGWAWGKSVQQTSDGGFILLGRYRDAGADDVWLTRTDRDGNQLWSNTFGESGIIDEGCSVQQTSDGGFTLLGRTQSYGAGGWDFWLIRTDGDGNEIWNQTFGGSESDNAMWGQQTFDGGFILLGSTDSYGAGDADFWLIRTDGDGNEFWNKTFGGSGRDEGISVQQTSDGGFILLGRTQSYGAGLTDFWLVRTDSDGNERWNKSFGGSGEDYGRSVHQAPDGGFMLAGDTTSYGAGSADFWLIKTDSDGNEVWNKTFGGSGTEWAFSVQQTSDGGFAMLGSTTSYGAGMEDFWLIRTAGDGPPPCDLEVALSGYPEEVLRGDYLTFDAIVANTCDAPLAFDRALMNITGPASLEKALYEGDPLPVVGSVAANLSLAVPPRAPLGAYTVEVTVFRDGEAIDADTFEVNVSG